MAAGQKKAPAFAGACIFGSDCQQGSRILQELLKFLFGAFHGGFQGTAEVQAEHFHEALAVDLMDLISHQYREGTGSGKVYKRKNILNGLDANLKFSHKLPPALYKQQFFVYNLDRTFGFPISFAIL